jgi:hypothetical protein
MKKENMPEWASLGENGPGPDLSLENLLNLQICFQIPYSFEFKIDSNFA